VSRPTFSGRDIVKVLENWGFTRVSGGKGSHMKLRYINPDTGEKRTVIVPDHEELDRGTRVS
jgi:predicted RNA binding protein YcfA (HicA-like mRNA interferase family)